MFRQPATAADSEFGRNSDTFLGRGLHLIRAIASDPVPYLHDVGMMFVRLARFEIAAALFRAGVDNNPKHIDLWSHLVDCYLTLNDSHRAREAALESQSALPGDYGADLNLGRIAARASRYQEATEHFEKALAKAPEERRNTYNLVMTLMRTENYDRARPLLHSYIKLAPNDADAHVLLGSCETQANNFEAALAEFDIAKRIDPNSGTVRFNHALLLRAKGDFDEALVELRALLSSKARSLDDVQIAFEIANTLAQGKRREEALAEYLKLADDKEEGAHARLHAAIMYLRLQRVDEAKQIFEQLLRDMPADLTVIMNLAAIAFLSGHLASADALGERALKSAGSGRSRKRIYTFLAAVKLAAKKHAEAIRAADSALDGENKNRDATLVKVHALFELGKYEEADELLAVFSKLHPSDVDILSDRVVLQLVLEKSKEALALARRLSRLSSSPDIDLLLIRALMSESRTHEARDVAEALTRRSPKNPDAWTYLALLTAEISEVQNDSSAYLDVVSYAQEALKWLTYRTRDSARLKVEAKLHSIAGYASASAGRLFDARRHYDFAHRASTSSGQSTLIIERNLRRVNESLRQVGNNAQLLQALLFALGIGVFACAYKLGASGHLKDSALAAVLVAGIVVIVLGVILPQIRQIKVAGVELTRVSFEANADLRLETDPVKTISRESISNNHLHEIRLVGLPIGFFSRAHD